jgi:hypothetical protein
MATGKKYYWIKLRKDFMNGDIVDFLMGQKNGAQYVVLYQMLCLMCINTRGELSRKIGEVIVPFDADKIQRDCKYFSRDTVVIALGLFKKLGLIYEQSEGSLFISDFENLIGSETDYARQKRIQRKDEHTHGQALDTTVDNVHGNVSSDALQALDTTVDNVHGNVLQNVPQMSIQSKSIEKEYRINKNIMCKADALTLFERLWQMYPVKRGKGQVSNTAKMRLYKIGFDEMSRAIVRYKQYVNSVDYLAYQNGSTFFNSGYIDYLDDNYSEETIQKKQKNSFNNFPQRNYNFKELEEQLTEN